MQLGTAEAFVSFPLYTIEVKAVRGAHRKAAVYNTLQSEKGMKFKSRQSPYVHILTESLGTASPHFLQVAFHIYVFLHRG